MVRTNIRRTSSVFPSIRADAAICRLHLPSQPGFLSFLSSSFLPSFFLSFFFFFFCILLLLFVLLLLYLFLSLSFLHLFYSARFFICLTNKPSDSDWFVVDHYHACWIATAWASMQAALKPTRSILAWNRRSVHSTAQTEERRTWNCFNTLSRPIACYLKVQVFDHTFCKKVVFFRDRNARTSHRQSDQHWNFSTATLGKRLRDRGSANSLLRARRYHFQLNRTERKYACSRY